MYIEFEIFTAVGIIIFWGDFPSCDDFDLCKS